MRVSKVLTTVTCAVLTKHKTLVEDLFVVPQALEILCKFDPKQAQDHNFSQAETFLREK